MNSPSVRSFVCFSFFLLFSRIYSKNRHHHHHGSQLLLVPGSFGNILSANSPLSLALFSSIQNFTLRILFPHTHFWRVLCFVVVCECGIFFCFFFGILPCSVRSGEENRSAWLLPIDSCFWILRPTMAN